MKTIILKRLLLLALIAALGWSHATAQIFTNLYNFTGGSDGDYPRAGLVLSGNTLYGTTYFGGTNDSGTVFKINTDGTGFTNLYSFTGGTGSYPGGNLILSGNTLYGTTYYNTVFKINTDGTCFTTLHNFTGSDGVELRAGLVLSSNTLYGTTYIGGTGGAGTIFAVKTDGTDFTNLCNFTGGSDGDSPYGGLVLSGNTLYGTTEYGGGSSGPSDSGTIFAINTDGTGFTNLYSFSQVSYSSSLGYTNSDGAYPLTSLILSGNTLYGITSAGGTNGSGTVFAIDTNGTGFTNLYKLNYGTGDVGGNGPYGGVMLSGNTLYITTGGIAAVSEINIDGTVYTNLYFPLDYPSSLVLSGNTLYGTTAFNTVFALSLGPIPLHAQSSGQNLILTWGNPAFSLQSASALTGQWTTVSNAASPYTISTTNAQAFFRLAYTNSP